MPSLPDDLPLPESTRQGPGLALTLPDGITRYPDGSLHVTMTAAQEADKWRLCRVLLLDWVTRSLPNLRIAEVAGEVKSALDAFSMIARIGPQMQADTRTVSRGIASITQRLTLADPPQDATEYDDPATKAPE